MAPDAELLAKWAAGDKASGEALIERHFAALHRFFVTTAPSHAQDLVQETFLACLQSRDRFRGDASFRGFLFGIARNVLVMFWRTHARKGAAVDPAIDSLEDLGATPTHRLARCEEERLLLQALRRIPLEAQILLQLHYWEGCSGPALAVALGVPEGTVRSRLRLAKSRLRAVIETLPADDAVLRSTLDDLDRWAASVRKRFESEDRK
jgi:RNA polymerase sigma-70 factor (ECF subfamily)